MEEIKKKWYKKPITKILGTVLFSAAALWYIGLFNIKKDDIILFGEKKGIYTTARYEAQQKAEGEIVQQIRENFEKAVSYHAGEDGILQNNELMNMLRAMGFEGTLQDKQYSFEITDQISEIMVSKTNYGSGCAGPIDFIYLPRTTLETYVNNLK